MLSRLGQRHQQLRSLLKDLRSFSASRGVGVSSNRTFTSAALSSRRVVLNQRNDASLVGCGPLSSTFGSQFSSALNQREADADDGDSVTGGHKTAAEYERQMQRCLRSGPRARVYQLFNEMKADEVEPNKKSYTLIMRAHARDGNLSMVDKLFDEMQENGLKPDTIAYNTYIHAFAQTKDVARAMEVLQQMREDDVPLSAVTYRTIINVCGKGKDLAKAKELYEEMMETLGDEKDIRNCNVMLNAYSENVTDDTAEQVYEEALKLFNEAKNGGLEPDIHTYSFLMRLCGRSGMKEEALEYLAKAKKLKDSPRLTQYDIMIECIGEMQLPDEQETAELISLFKHMETNEVRPSALTYETLLTVMSEKGKTTKFLEVLDKLQEEGLSRGGAPLGGRLQCIEKLGADGTNSPEETQRLTAEILEKVKGFGRNLTYPGYRAWLNICKAASDVKQATELWERITSDHRKIDDDIIESMMELYLKHDKVSDAMDFFLYMHDNNIQPTLKEFQLLFEYFAENEDTEKAAEVHKKMKAAKVEPDDHVRELMTRLQLI